MRRGYSKEKGETVTEMEESMFLSLKHGRFFFPYKTPAGLICNCRKRLGEVTAAKGESTSWLTEKCVYVCTSTLIPYSNTFFSWTCTKRLKKKNTDILGIWEKVQAGKET